MQRAGTLTGEPIGRLIARRRRELGKSQQRLADLLCAVSGHPTVTRHEVSRWERGARVPVGETLCWLAQVLAIEMDTLEIAAANGRGLPPAAGESVDLDADELSRRVSASDVGAETLARIEGTVDDLAVAYPATAPVELLDQVRVAQGYLTRLLDKRKTLAEHRRLLVAGGWLSLLAATVLTDLRQWPAAGAWLRTADELGVQCGHAEIRAWCLETRAWAAVTQGRCRHAAELSQAAQAVAPRGSSAYIQATAQEARAWARLGEPTLTYDALDRLTRLVAPLPTPDRPEHHYRYDPAKSLAFTATTLAWLGDPAAVGYSRDVLRRLESTADGGPRPRRAASARLDLALALMAADNPGEASDVAMRAVLAGRLVPSNYWRAEEVMVAVERRDPAAGRQLWDAYRTIYGFDQVC